MLRVAMLVVVVLAACSKDDGVERGTTREEREADEAPPPPKKKAKPEPTLGERIAKAENYTDALRIAGPVLSDEIDKISDGAILLAIWVDAQRPWAELAVEDETTTKRVMKDSDEERGRRMCARGRIVEIEKVSDDPKVFSGGLSTSSYDIVRFLAAGSTGDLVGSSRGRICGVVVGEYAYSNVGGGQTRAVMLVGMFDLPENKPTPAPKAPR